MMKRGFILTESEKNRIKSLYSLIKEQTEYTLDSPDKIKQFQDWMDGKYGKWAESLKFRGKFYSVKGREQYGYGFNRSQTTKAWSKYGDEYMKEKKLGKYSAQEEKPKTKTEVGGITSTETGAETGVETGKQKGGPNVTNIGKIETGDATTTTTTGFDYSMKEKTTQIDPFDRKGKYDYSEEGFKNWYKGVYNKDFDPTNKTIEIKNDSAIITAGDNRYTYTYNKDLQSWNSPPVETKTPKKTKINLGGLFGKKTQTKTSSQAETSSETPAP